MRHTPDRPVRPGRVALVAGLVLLAALAGCSLAGGPATTATTAATTTAPTTASATTTTAPSRLDPGLRPPGTDAAALVDPEALLGAHADRLTADGYGYELRVNATVRRRFDGEPRTVRVARRSVAYVEPGSDRYRRTLVNAGTGVRFDVWGNRTTELTRVTVGNGTRYRIGEPTDPRSLTGATVLGPYLRASSFTVAGVDRQGDRTLVALTARGLAPGADPEAVLPPGASNLSAYRARLVVDPAGRIHRLTATGTYAVGDERARFRVRYRLTASEGVAIERPSWVGTVDRAANATGG